MGKFIYTTKFANDAPINDKLDAIKNGLDITYQYTHSKHIGSEMQTRENYYLHGDKFYLGRGTGMDLAKLNFHLQEGKKDQARFILHEVGKLTNSEDYVFDYLLNNGGMTSINFKTLFMKLAYKDGSTTELIDEKAINEILERSQEIEPSFDLSKEPDNVSVDSEESYDPEERAKEHQEKIDQIIKEDEELIAFNEDPKNQAYFDEIDDLSATNTIKALGFDRKEIDKSLEIIDNANPEEAHATTINQFKKLISNNMDKIPTAEKDEGKFIEESEKLYTIFKFYGKNKLQADLMPSIKDYIEGPEYRSFAISNTATRGVAGLLNRRMAEFDERPNLKNTYYKEMIDVMKHVQNIHNERSLWSRFKDWFNPNGEYRTLNKCKNFLMKRNFNKKDIERDLLNSTGDMSKYSADNTIDDHINTDTKQAYFTKDSDIYTSNQASKNLDMINITTENIDNLKKLDEKYELGNDELQNLNPNDVAPLSPQEIEEEENILSNNTVPMKNIERDSSIQSDEYDDDGPDYEEEDIIEPSLGDE